MTGSTDKTVNSELKSDVNQADEVGAAAENNAVLRVIAPKVKDLGGFSVRRLLPVMQQKMVGPWIFFDHMGPVDFPAGQGIDVRPHPHIHLATVSYLFEGEILHRDSVGSEQRIRPGDVNLMVAGRGIVHSERESADVRAQPHRLHGLQLWLALPEADQDIDPAFYHYPAATIPASTIHGVKLRVLMGSAYGLQSPVLCFASTLYVEADLQAGQQLQLPEVAELALYVAKGAVTVQQQSIAEYEMAIINTAVKSVVLANSDCRIALIGGEAVGPRFIDWNFVSTSKQRIEQAKQQWQQWGQGEQGPFQQVPGDTVEWIPLPE